MPIDLTTTIQAIPYAQNVAHAELVHPDAQLAASQLLARQTLLEQHKQAPPVEKLEKMETVGDERQRQQQERRPLRERRNHEQSTEPDSAPSNPTPFAGHIIDRKI